MSRAQGERLGWKPVYCDGQTHRRVLPANDRTLLFFERGSSCRESDDQQVQPDVN